ncbi:hypothetical protein IHE44_0005377 [Lamprotornis superbus]|uniref:G-protein coupled receptors family 1 profile domain-containing protein n=1 Tax=Lamprotornis superbus TaxID=245042 RepID=A0A835NM88_9PASS|nr:hypothetical protein IHE44_0005377 [Lamprotornis superbus]
MEILFYLSASINPVLYNLVSKKYRAAACKLLLPRRAAARAFTRLSVTNNSAKGLIQAARDWWGTRCSDHSLSLSAMSLYELISKHNIPAMRAFWDTSNGTSKQTGLLSKEKRDHDAQQSLLMKVSLDTSGES